MTAICEGLRKGRGVKPSLSPSPWGDIQPKHEPCFPGVGGHLRLLTQPGSGEDTGAVTPTMACWSVREHQGHCTHHGTTGL